ncbi:predicted protein [Botrytis cinerea T4]|uniref:Uncharacterized protein n=1 Tax=Botryotinia fuckeliana (strain T4) TaxID=999810 RepID=G2Y796_BOTF4|nr:predicted protein [Botrytis cinerea T4]
MGRAPTHYVDGNGKGKGKDEERKVIPSFVHQSSCKCDDFLSGTMSCNPNLARLGTKEESKFQRQMEKKEKMTKAVATRDLEKWEPEVSMCEINKQSPTIGHESLQYTFVKVRA